MKLAAVFDVDGVLVDSLPAHLQMCELLAREYGLPLTVPDDSAFRELVRRGVTISPMLHFFTAVGFPEAAAARAEADYEASFATRFAPEPFPDVREMLARLTAAGVGLGIVSANTRRNVGRALGPLLDLFAPRRVITRDEMRHGTKADALRTLSVELDLPCECIVYVGDQPSDAAAARAAGCPFIGVTYGWAFARGDERADGPLAHHELAEAPVEVAERILGRLRSLAN